MRERSISKLLLACLAVVAFATACASAPTKERPSRQRAALEIANRSAVTVWLYLDHRFLGELESGARYRYTGVPSGDLLLEYRFPPQTKMLSQRITLFDGRVTRVVLARAGDKLHPVPAPFGALVLRNSSDVDLIVHLGERRLGVVLARDWRRFDDVPAGRHLLVARDHKLHVHQRMKVRIGMDGVREIELARRPATLVVDNRTKERLDIYRGEKLLGRVPARSIRKLRGLETGSQTLRAVGKRTKSVHRLLTDIRPGRIHPWVISVSPSSIVVVNNTNETLKLFVDNHQMTTMAPGKRVELDNVRLGTHRLAVVGTTTGNRQIREVDLNAAERMRWVVDHLASGILVSNRTRWNLELYDDVRIATLKPGFSKVVDLKGRPSVDLEVRIPGGRLRLRRTFVAKNSEVVSWEITVPSASLQIVNRTPNVLELVVNKRSMGTVAPKRDVRLEVAVGRNDIVLIERRSGVRYPKRVLVQPSRDYRWVVEPKLGGLRVANETGEEIELWIGNRPSVTLPAGESRIFPQLPRGVVALRARGQKSGAEYVAKRTIIAEKRLLWAIKPSYGDLTVVNQLIHPVRLLIGEKEVGQIPSQGSRAFRLPVGTHRLSAWREGKSDLRRTRVSIKSLGTHRWQIREDSARLTIFNGTDEDLEVRLEDKYLGIVKPHRTARFENLVFRPLKLTAIGMQSHARYMTTKTLKPHRLFRWEILPAVGSVSIHNKLREALVVEVDDLKISHRIAPGGTRRFLVPVGKRRIVVRGETSLNVARFRRTVFEGHVQRFEFARWGSRLRIENRLDESVEIEIDGRGRGPIPPRSTRVFADLPLGNRLVSVRSRSGRHDRRRIFTFARDLHTWVLQ